MIGDRPKEAHMEPHQRGELKWSRTAEWTPDGYRAFTVGEWASSSISVMSRWQKSHEQRSSTPRASQELPMLSSSLLYSNMRARSAKQVPVCAGVMACPISRGENSGALGYLSHTMWGSNCMKKLRHSLKFLYISALFMIVQMLSFLLSAGSLVFLHNFALYRYGTH